MSTLASKLEYGLNRKLIPHLVYLLDILGIEHVLIMNNRIGSLSMNSQHHIMVCSNGELKCFRGENEVPFNNNQDYNAAQMLHMQAMGLAVNNQERVHRYWTHLCDSGDMDEVFKRGLLSQEDIKQYCLSALDHIKRLESEVRDINDIINKSMDIKLVFSRILLLEKQPKITNTPATVLPF